MRDFKILWTLNRGLFFLLVTILIMSCNNAGNEQSNSDENDTTNLAQLYEQTEAVQESKKKIIKKTKLAPPKTASSGQQAIPKNIKPELPDFSVYKNTVKKKKAFFNFLSPYVIAENKKVLIVRDTILSKFQLVNSGMELNESDIIMLEDLAEEYRIENQDVGTPEFFSNLLLHVDIIPAELALVQAANESAWGSSYFARNVNNLYGQWCFTPGCGIVPRQRMAGETHEVAVYGDLSQSVGSYIQYLNSHPAFSELRKARYTARLNGKKPSGYDMAVGLSQYSGIGKAYVKTLRSMIKSNMKYIDLAKVNKPLK